MRNDLHKENLNFYGQTVNGVILPGLVQVFQAGGHHVFGFVKPVEVFDLRIGVGLEGVVEELGLDPAGIHGHAADAPGLQFPVQGPAVAENEGLGSTVGGDVGHRLAGG